MTIGRQSTGQIAGRGRGEGTGSAGVGVRLSRGPVEAAIRRVGGLLLVGALAALPGCSAYDEIFGDEPVPGIVTTGTGAQQDEVVPNLASVPGRPQPSSASQRQALQEGLRQDRERAVYSTQPASRPAPSSAPSTADEMVEDVERPSLPPAPPPPSSSASRAPAPAASAGRRADASQDSSSRRAAAVATPAPASPPPASPPPASSAPSAVGPGQIAGYNLPRRPGYSELLGVVFFGYGSAALDQRDVEVLRQVVRVQQQRGGQLRVVGHASLRTGVADPLQHNLANFNTSLERAQNVARRLEALGAPGVVVEAMGSAQPVYYEFMPTGEAGNRRAEIFLDF